MAAAMSKNTVVGSPGTTIPIIPTVRDIVPIRM